MTSFSTIEDAKAFRLANAELIRGLEREAESVMGVIYTDVWLNGASPSFVAGYNCEDIHVVSFPI